MPPESKPLGVGSSTLPCSAISLRCVPVATNFHPFSTHPATHPSQYSAHGLVHDAAGVHDPLIGQVGQGLLQAAQGRGLATERRAHQHHAVPHHVALIEPGEVRLENPPRRGFRGRSWLTLERGQNV